MTKMLSQLTIEEVQQYFAEVELLRLEEKRSENKIVRISRKTSKRSQYILSCIL